MRPVASTVMSVRRSKFGQELRTVALDCPYCYRSPSVDVWAQGHHWRPVAHCDCGAVFRVAGGTDYWAEKEAKE